MSEKQVVLCWVDSNIDIDSLQVFITMCEVSVTCRKSLDHDINPFEIRCGVGIFSQMSNIGILLINKWTPIVM